MDLGFPKLNRALTMAVWGLAILMFTAGCATLPTSEEVIDEEPLPPEEPEPAGLILIKDFESPELGNKRTLRILLPESYGTTEQSYPVVYLHDGRNVFAPGGQFGSWGVEKVYGRLHGEGKIKEAILVGIDSTSRRMGEYTPTPDEKKVGGEGDKYLDFLQNTVMPWVEANYRALKGPENTVLIGSSLGGLISFYAGWTRPQVFGMVGCLSSSFWWDDESMLSLIRATPGAASGSPPSQVKIYLDAGNREGDDSDGNGVNYVLEDTLNIAMALREMGWRSGRDLLVDFDPEGQHNERSWRARVGTALQFFLGTAPESLKALDPVPSRKVVVPGGKASRFMIFMGAEWNNGLRGDLLPGEYTVVMPEGKWTLSSRGECTLESLGLSTGDSARFLFEAGDIQGALDIKVMP